MNTLVDIHRTLIRNTGLGFERYLLPEIDWNNRLIGLLGARGTGKTTLLLQHIKTHFENSDEVLYASLDNIWFAKNSLFDMAMEFSRNGGNRLFLDEVHRYPNWSVELKNIYDSIPDMYVVFTGSSILEIYKSNADLSRRAVSYHLAGLSFREYLKFEGVLEVDKIALPDLLTNHVALANGILSKIKVFPHFKRYLELGYYPYYKENENLYTAKINQVVSNVLESDLPAIENIDQMTVNKIKRLLYIISGLVPFSPNLTKLATEIGASRNNIWRYLNLLHKAELIYLLEPQSAGMAQLAKADKIFLNNTNILHALSAVGTINEGNLRETFFVNQLKVITGVFSSKEGDFRTDKGLCFEIGGANKNFDQIKDLPQSYVVADNIEVGFKNKIPLWLFGFLY